MNKLCTSARAALVAAGLTIPAQASLAQDSSVTLSTQGASNFDINAGISVSEQFTDNVFLTANDRRPDFVTVVAPWVDVSYRRENLSFNIEASAEFGRFADYSNEDYEDYFLAMNTRYRINDSLFVFAGIDHAWDHENRTSPDDVNGIVPTDLRETTGYAGIGGKLGERSFRLGFNARALDFDDVPATGGVIIDNDDRDRMQYEFGGRLGVAQLGPGEVFVQAIYDWRDYEDTVDNAGTGFQRSSAGYQAAIGYTGSVGAMSGELLLGVMSQDYDDPRFDTTTALDYGLNLRWPISDATQLTAIVDRSLEETTLTGASGYISSSAGLRLRHRVAQNMSLAGYAFVTENDYQEVPRTDVLTEVGVSLRYYLNPNLYFDTEYDFQQRQSDVAGVEYDEHRISFRFGTRLDPQYDRNDFTPARADSTRFYAGVQVGHDALQTKVSGPRGAAGGNLTADFGDTGHSVGLFGGFRTQYGKLALGLELEAENSDSMWAHFGSRTFMVARNASYGLSALTGYRTAQGNLVYGRFGLVSTEFTSTYQQGANPLVRKTDTQMGLMAGVGTEFPLGRNLSGRFEYLLRAYDDYQIGSPLGGLNDDNFPNVESVARLGLVYEFGPGTPAPENKQPTDFSGFYFGGNLGHGTLQSDNTGPRPNAAAPTFTLNATRAGQGFTLGAMAGYGHTFDRLYLGAEADIELSSADWNIERSPVGRVYSVDKKASVGVSLRAGYVINDSVLLYGRAGIVQSRFNTNYRTTGNAVDQDNDLNGIRIGAGVEFAIDRGMNIRFDYSHTDYDSHAVNYGGGGSPRAVPWLRLL